MHLSLELQTATDADLINPMSPAGLVYESSGQRYVWMSEGRVRRERERGQRHVAIGQSEAISKHFASHNQKPFTISLDVIYIYFKASA